MRRLVATAIALAGIAGAAVPARADGVMVMTASAYQYLPGDDGLDAPLAIEQGTTLYFFNADTSGWHTVTGEPSPTGASWFDTPDQVGFGSYAEVVGVDRLEPGTYRFYCTPHYPDMQGTLVVQAHS